MPSSDVTLTGDWARFGLILHSLAKPDLSEPLKKIGEYMVAQTEERFTEEQGPDGKKWKPSRRAERTGGQTLTDTSRMRRSIDYAVDEKAGVVEVGTNVKYAPSHQFGMSGKKTIPARPFLGFSKKNEEKIQDILEGWMRRKVR